MGISPDALYNAIRDDVSGMALPQYEAIPYPGCTYKQYASTYLLHSIIRKWIPKDTAEADSLALGKFTQANNLCKDWSLTFSDEGDRQVFGEIRKILDDFFHPSGEFLIQDYYDLLRNARPGPGVSAGVKGTSLYEKYFASPLTTTSLRLYEEYKRYSEWIPFLSDAECQRYDRFGPPSVTSGSVCSFVPKTASASRMICIEPSLNMYFQLGLASLLEARLKGYFGINLETQPHVNSLLARKGSIDGSYATIDLSSASDSISLRLCESILPEWFFHILLDLRSRTTKINGRNVPLFMISTMGNGFTFPLQTIIFSAILKACLNCFAIKSSHAWSCFGDDLICPREIYDRVVRTLAMLGFSVNADKTFNEGPFRESCGTDWFYGQPVRPVFIRKLDLPYDIMVAINQLNDWSAYTGISLRSAVSLLFNSLESKFRNLVPYDSSMDSGIRVPLAIIKPKFDSNLSFVYKTWERKASKIRLVDQELRAPGLSNKKLWFNPDGLYCSFLFGELVNYTISVRHNRKMYRTRLRCSPYWDYIPFSSLTNGVRLLWQQWETAVLLNLGGDFPTY